MIWLLSEILNALYLINFLTSSTITLYWFPYFVVLCFCKIQRNENGRDKQMQFLSRGTHHTRPQKYTT